jgi:hypothetical protein
MARTPSGPPTEEASELALLLVVVALRLQASHGLTAGDFGNGFVPGGDVVGIAAPWQLAHTDGSSAFQVHHAPWSPSTVRR